MKCALCAKEAEIGNVCLGCYQRESAKMARSLDEQKERAKRLSLPTLSRSLAESSTVTSVESYSLKPPESLKKAAARRKRRNKK